MRVNLEYRIHAPLPGIAQHRAVRILQERINSQGSIYLRRNNGPFESGHHIKGTGTCRTQDSRCHMNT
ncbi:hypothetical protein BABINDRAFT_159409 [Babjeviella inositovora NRRL Y-12698]|uniref:Uncharacterized protein n=1 Tax=Babjeviella inositovora NRRL Y-12698 TaxID=984486 RepID=A0A1E3QZ71_9ASCO|nr:uncharacterized protein BABINDRAFT_159409 [Babjeviella inositovora NRRL Y-12698]ODQ82921.1 hypothetical protein BABINDRAFT_159409 [Babjeviella inositovora NRRL Y-12698]